MNNKKKIIALIVVLATLVQVLAGGMVFAYNSVVSEKVEENNVQFKDISGHWAENSINYLANKGLVKGYIADDGYVIKPQEFITRAEFLTVLINSRPDIEFTNENVKSFIDVKEGEWYKEIVDKASSIGILSGYPDGSFKPNNPITRAEITALIMKFNNWSEKDIDYESKLFSDVKEGEWHFIPIMVCRSKKIVNGYPDGTFAPQRFALRGEAFALLANYVKNYLHSASAELDDMAPIVENKDITIYNQSSTSVTLNWYKAFDDKTAKENLRYAVYLSRKDNISNIEGVLTNGTLIGEYEKDIESKEIKGLASGTTYYFNVVVKDDSDNKTAYNPIKVFFRESSSNIQTGADDSKVIITSPQMGSSRYYTYESHVDISGVFTNKEIDKISYSVFYEGKEDKDSSYPAITKGSYDKNTNTTNWSIKDFPAKYLCVTVEIYITDKSGKRHMGWIDIVQEGDDDNDGLSNYLEKLLGTDPNNPDTDGDGLTDWEESYTYETDPLKYDTDGDGISDGDEVLYVYIRDMDSEGRVYFIKKLRSELEPDIASALRVVYKDDNYVPADLDLTNEDHRDYYRWYYEYIPRNYVILDPLNHDTDEDGLPDGFELYSSMTSPSAYDTYNDDMSDADRDPDEDGLTNIQEYINGTDPLNRDTDGDSIIDGDEVELDTNPLLRDSDNDGTDDLEEIMRGTDPNDPDNGGIDDIANMVEQRLDYENIKHLDDGNNVAVPSITIKGTGDINKTTEVYNALANPLIKEFESIIIGYPIEIETSSKFETAEIKFCLNPEFISKEDINNLRIFYYNKEINAIEILDTEINADELEIYSNVTHFSIYGVIDITKYAEEMQVHNEESKLERGVADIVFVIDTTGSMSGTINNVRTNINSFVDMLALKDVDVRLGIVEYKDIYEDGLDSTKVWKWHETVSDFRETMSNLKASGGGDSPETTVDALEAARRMDFRSYASKFIIVFTDATTKPGSRYEGIATFSDVTHKLIDDRICVSVVSRKTHMDHYEDLYMATTGIWADLYSNFYNVLSQLSDRIATGTMGDGVWIRLSNGTAVKLNKYPDKNDLITDTDGDGIPDSQELIEEVEIIIQMPTGPSYKFNAWTFGSNPAKADTDDDGIIDSEDENPLTPDGIVNLTVTPLEGNATDPFLFTADVAPKLKDKFDYILLQFRLPGGAWIQSRDILANPDYISRFSMNFDHNIGDSEPERKGFDRYKKTIWILDPGTQERQGLRYFRVLGIYKDRTQKPFTSTEMAFIVNSTSITLSGLTTSVIEGTHNFTIRKYDNNVKKIGVYLMGDTTDVPDYVPEYGRYIASEKEIGIINPIDGTISYNYAFDSTQYKNGKYELYAKAFDSEGKKIHETYHKEFSIKNKAAVPEFSVEPGCYNEKQVVRLSSKSPGSYFYYTTDGTTPTLSSQRYDATRGIVIDKTTTLKVFAWNIKYENSPVVEAEYIIDPTALPSGKWNFHKGGTDRLSYLSDKDLNRTNLTKLEEASKNLTIRLEAINKRIQTEVAQKYLDLAGSKAPSAYNTKHKVIAALTWDDTKVQKLYNKGGMYQKYGVDQRMLLAIICQEGTGSFNTNSEVKDKYGGNYVQPDFEKDIAAALENHGVKKLNAYKYYWKQFEDSIKSLAKTKGNANITKGKGDLYQFLNYCTLGATIENGVITKVSTMGMYAEDNDWWSKVKTIFDEIVENNGNNPSEKYSEFVKTIKTPIKAGYELPKVKFIETSNGKVWSDNNTWLSGYSLITAVLDDSPSISFPLKYQMKANNADTSNLIYQVQTLLNNNLSPDLKSMLSLEVDSHYGPLTTAVVKLYQQQNNAKEITGEVNEEMFNLLKNGSWKLTKPGEGKYVLKGTGSSAYYEWVSTDPSQWLRINKSRNDLVNKAKELLTIHNGDPLHYFWGGNFGRDGGVYSGYHKNWGKTEKVTVGGNWSTGKNVPYGRDCSGYVQWVYYQITGIDIGNTTYAQKDGIWLEEIDSSQAKPGDLVYNENFTHVGMYIGKDTDGLPMFIHAAGSAYGTPEVKSLWGDDGNSESLDKLREMDNCYVTGRVIISKFNQSLNDPQYSRIKSSAQFVISKDGKDVVVPYRDVKVIKESNRPDRFEYHDAKTNTKYQASIKSLPMDVNNYGQNLKRYFRVKVRFSEE